MKKRIKELIEKAEGLNWTVNNIGENEYEFQKYSPAGQDFNMYITGESDEEIIGNIYKYHENFDISEETSLWIDETGHGTNGAPYHIQDLVDDMTACKEMIMELYNELTGVPNRKPRQKLILDDLQEVYNKLQSVLVDLKIENMEEQFDYCTAPELSNLYDNIETTIKDIEKIIYQK